MIFMYLFLSPFPSPFPLFVIIPLIIEAGLVVGGLSWGIFQVQYNLILV